MILMPSHDDQVFTIIFVLFPRLLCRCVDDDDVVGVGWSGDLGRMMTTFVLISRLLCRCVDKARKQGYQYIGLHFFGECWSGPGSENYQQGGQSGSMTGCHGYTTCYH